MYRNRNQSFTAIKAGLTLAEEFHLLYDQLIMNKRMDEIKNRIITRISTSHLTISLNGSFFTHSNSIYEFGGSSLSNGFQGLNIIKEMPHQQMHDIFTQPIYIQNDIIHDKYIADEHTPSTNTVYINKEQPRFTGKRKRFNGGGQSKLKRKKHASVNIGDSNKTMHRGIYTMTGDELEAKSLSIEAIQSNEESSKLSY